jgi:acetyl-CoA carboxylase biotin carboxylase subunit
MVAAPIRLGAEGKRFRMFRRVLVANRGEIAVRIMRTLRDMGVESVAVFSEADAKSAHVRQADFARCIGPAAAAESYLDIDAVLDAARQTECDALIPGYGFLSERGDFARSCQEAGVVFIGPRAEAIETMGDKLLARDLAERVGVPLLPGAHVNSAERARQAADEIGYPVLLKAAGGGGGKGMRRLDDGAALERAFDAAQREALRAFGNDQLYVERALSTPRHVEVQVLGDQHGNLVHLCERDCSIQRRHQKVVEETPSPGLDATLRERMTQSALTLAAAVDYDSVGTVEFLVDGSEYYFLEMNTRLQVEHTVTELITGLDLVREMVLVATGEPLGRDQDALGMRGAAIQCRIYAEDPSAGFLPRTGDIEVLQEPAGPFIRTDSGVLAQGQVGSDYDPLLAKICAWGEDRTQALTRMRRALHETRIDGVQTNLDFLRRLLQERQFSQGRYDTSYLSGCAALESQPPTPHQLAALAAVGHRRRRRTEDELAPAPVSNWARSGLPDH